MIVLKKTVDSLISLFVIASLTFVLLRFLPGGPFDDEVALPIEIKQQVQAEYHLDQSIPRQYMIFLSQLARGDLGLSYKVTQVRVTDLIAESMGPSLLLGTMALTLALALGIFCGVICAVNFNNPIDRFFRFLMSLLISFPSFLSGPFFVLVFSFWLDWFPPALWNGPKYYVLPTLTLALRPIALVSRLVRRSFLDAATDLYTRMAFAKGLSRFRVYGLHVLRNSILPVLAILPPLTAGMLSGSFVIETVFAIPGLGRYLVDSVLNRDFPLVMGLTLFYSVILILANWVNEVLTVVLDPRLRRENG